MLEWLIIFLVATIVAKKTTKWKYRILLSLFFGFFSAAIEAIFFIANSAVKKIDHVIIGGITNAIFIFVIIGIIVLLFNSKNKFVN